MSAGPDVVLVRCSGLTRVFGEGPGAVTAVKDVGCQLLPGARVAVSGPQRIFSKLYAGVSSIMSDIRTRTFRRGSSAKSFSATTSELKMSV